MLKLYPFLSMIVKQIPENPCLVHISTVPLFYFPKSIEIPTQI